MNGFLQRRRTKIVCTLGPSSESFNDVLSLAQAGMDVARFNFSHGTHGEHAARMETVRAVSELVERPIGVLQDLQGPKIRLGRFAAGEVELASGDPFMLTVQDVTGDSRVASVSYASFPHDVAEGDAVLLDDGRITLEVREVRDTDVHCKVVHGGTLSDNSGLNLPNALLSVGALSEKDRADLDFGLQMDVDFVAVSFVQKASDLADVRAHIAKSRKRAAVVAKIERRQAVVDFDAISAEADVVMIARGDLGVEMLTEEVPVAQKELIARCNVNGIPVITATQMLDSMIRNPRPTRAEASDVANAVLDGSDALMLSGETAAGAYAAETVTTMDHIVRLVEERSENRWDLKRRKPDLLYSRPLAVGYSVCHAAELVQARAIVCLTQSGQTARMIARFRPSQPVIAVSSSLETYRRLSLAWGVTPLLLPHFGGNVDDAVDQIVSMLRGLAVVDTGDKLIVTTGVPFARHSETNMLRIEEV